MLLFGQQDRLKNKPIESRLDGDTLALSKKEKRKQKEKKKKRPSTSPTKQLLLQDLSLKKDEQQQQADKEKLEETLFHPEIIALSQQSRFHTATFDEFGKNILLNQVNLSISTSKKGKSIELLVDTQLKLNYGYKYGLVGPNGIGKSTLLQALGDGLFEGLPSNLNILYVNQLDTSLLTATGTSIEQKTILQTVLDADQTVGIIKSRIQILQDVLMGRQNPDKLYQFKSHKAELFHALLQVRLLEAIAHGIALEKIAVKRSGMRGKDARLRSLEQEAVISTLKQQMVQLLEEEEEHQEQLVTKEEADILREIHDLLQEYQQKLKDLDEPSMESRARRILKSMNIDEIKQESPLHSLSGGWQIRVLLARILFMEPDLLLLDEPTNHLDMPSILWLKNYLQTIENVLEHPVTLLLVCHDRFFLNEIVQEIIVFRGYDKQLVYYEGNYDAYELACARKRQENTRLAVKIQQKTEKMNQMVQKIHEQGAKAKDDKKLQVAASKKKKMERIGLEKNVKGGRFMLNRDRVGYFFTKRSQAEDNAKYETDYYYPSWKFLSSTPPQIRNIASLDNLTMLSMENIGFQYPKEKEQQVVMHKKTTYPLVVENFNLHVQYGDKVVLVGRNGAGKTTIMKLLDGTLKPISGKRDVFHGARIKSLMQHNVEDLKRHEWSRYLTPMELLAKNDEVETIATSSGGDQLTIDHLKKSGPTEGKLRGHLSSFGIVGETATSVKLENLSGGQLVRVGLAWVTYPHPPHVLLLDEPTNHLDMSTIQVFGEALRKYQGAVVLISHDLHFLHLLTAEKLANEEDQEDDDDDLSQIGRPARVYEVCKKKGIVSLVHHEHGVGTYQAKEEARQASLGKT